MRRIRGKFSGFQFVLPLAAPIIIGLVAAQPLLYGRLPKGIDLQFHLFRVIQLDALWQNGIIYSRWAPDLMLGYGYPLFNYYAPASYYFVELLHLLGLNFEAAMLTAFVLALIASSVFTFIFVNQEWGKSAGWVAAAGYALSPYLIFNYMVRGALAEQLALAWIPLLFLLFNRLAHRPTRLNWLAAGLGYAGIVLIHNITAFIVSPVLAAYTIFLASTTDHFPKTTSLTRSWSAIFSGVLISAFYWLPALLEQNLIQLNQAYLLEVFDVKQNFLRIQDLLKFPGPFDPSYLNPRIPISFNLVVLFLAFFGILQIRKSLPSKSPAFFTVFAALTTLMVTPASEILWAFVPGLSVIQFPWRFIGPASFFVAVLAGIGMVRLSHLTWRPFSKKWLLPLLLGLMTAFSFAWQFGRELPDSTKFENMKDSVQYEIESGYLGTTSTGEYTPRAVKEIPDAANVKFNFPEFVAVSELSLAPLDYQVNLNSPEPFTAVFNTFYFPGWTARLDGREVPITPTEPNGLISINMPPGQHDLAVKFGSTPIRQAATGITAASFILIGLAIGFWRGKNPQTTYQRPQTTPNPLPKPVILTLLLLLGAKSFVIDKTENLFRQIKFDPQTLELEGLENPIPANFDNQLFFLGLDTPKPTPSGSSGTITLYWTVRSENLGQYSINVSLANSQGIPLANIDKQHPGGLPVDQWTPEFFIEDEYVFAIPAGTPPGEYQLRVSAYPYGQPQKTINVVNESSNPMGRAVVWEGFTVTRPSRPARLTELNPQTLVEPTAVGGLTLSGYDWWNPTARPGDEVGFTLYWEVQQPLSPQKQMPLTWTDATGTAVNTFMLPLLEDLTAEVWQSGDTWRTLHTVRLPANLQSGRYTLVLPSATGTLHLGSIDVTAPERQMTRPDVPMPTEARFGDTARLVGFNTNDSAQPGDAVEVTLFWQALAESSVNYKVFVQLLDEDDRWQAGSDAIPANWTRPTTGWMIGEFISDTHSLTLPIDLPAGTYTLLVGLYDEQTNERLLLPSGEDAYRLTTLSIMP